MPTVSSVHIPTALKRISIRGWGSKFKVRNILKKKRKRKKLYIVKVNNKEEE